MRRQLTCFLTWQDTGCFLCPCLPDPLRSALRHTVSSRNRHSAIALRCLPQKKSFFLAALPSPSSSSRPFPPLPLRRPGLADF